MSTKIFNNNKELLAVVKEKEGARYIDFEYQNIVCEFAIELEGISIVNAGNIDAGDINALNIKALNIKAGDIKARDISARDINAEDINARDINAGDINALNINAGNISALNINARDISTVDINALNIKALNIKALNIKAGDINARDINAGSIDYYGVCFAYLSLKCFSIKGRRENCQHFCLDGAIEIISKKEPFKFEIEIEANTREEAEKIFKEKYKKVN